MSTRKRLRVLHVISGDLWAGAEAQAFTLITTLARMPEVCIAAAVLNEGDLSKRLRLAGVEVFVFEEKRSNPIAIFMRMFQLVRSWRPNVVHTHRYKENILGSLVCKFFRRVYCVRTTHGASERKCSRGLRRIQQQVLDTSDRWCGKWLQCKIIAVSRPLASELERTYGKRKVSVIENGIDVDSVRQCRGTAEFRSDCTDVLHVGIAARLVHVKRLDIFLRTAALLREKMPSSGWRFHLFGDGPLQEQLVELAKSLNLLKETTFHGHRTDIATLLRRNPPE